MADDPLSGDPFQPLRRAAERVARDLQASGLLDGIIEAQNRVAADAVRGLQLGGLQSEISRTADNLADWLRSRPDLTDQWRRNVGVSFRSPAAAQAGFAAVGADVAAHLADAPVQAASGEEVEGGDQGRPTNLLQALLLWLLSVLPDEKREEAVNDPTILMALLGIVVTLTVAVGTTTVTSAVTLLKSSPPPTIVVEPAKVDPPDVHVHIDGDQLRTAIDEAAAGAVERKLNETDGEDPDR